MNIEGYKKRENSVSDSTVNSRVSALKRFQREVGFTGEPEPSDVEDWIDLMIEEEVKPGTMRQYFKAVRYYFEKMKGGSDEIEHVRDWIPEGGTDHGDFLERDELERMRYFTYGARQSAIIELMYQYARRPTEIVLLNIEDLSLSDVTDGDSCPECESGSIKKMEDTCRYVCNNCDFEDVETITFPILKKDDSLRATFELLPQARKALARYIERYRSDRMVEAEQPWEEDKVKPLFTTNHGRISYDTVYNKIKEIAERADIDKNITPKSLRHSRATHLDWDGKSPENIARQQLVHNPDTQTISSYIHPRDEEEVREVMVTDDE